MILTSHYQHSKRGKDGKARNYIIYFLNDVEILKQKVPFDEKYELGFQNRTHFKNTYLLNGKLYQTREKSYSTKEARDVCFPISKKKLSQFDIPKDLKIEMKDGWKKETV